MKQYNDYKEEKIITFDEFLDKEEECYIVVINAHERDFVARIFEICGIKPQHRRYARVHPFNPAAYFTSEYGFFDNTGCYHDSPNFSAGFEDDDEITVYPVPIVDFNCVKNKTKQEDKFGEQPSKL